jgi:hypothetical protein
MWEDMLGYHYQQAYHCMVGGGDQIYCDAITREPELQGELTSDKPLSPRSTNSRLDQCTRQGVQAELPAHPGDAARD